MLLNSKKDREQSNTHRVMRATESRVFFCFSFVLARATVKED